MRSHLRMFLLTFFLITLSCCSTCLIAEPDIYFRFNQAGFLPDDYKSMVLLSNERLDGRKIQIIDSHNGRLAYNVLLKNSRGDYGNFRYTYVVDFSNLKAEGEYYFQIGRQKSYSFKIGKDVFNGIADSLLQFFKVQRCGFTDPEFHKVCHVADATSLIDGTRKIAQSFDVTGGWHDAGDYVKFLNTTAYATYMLLFSYEFDSVKFGFDTNHNNVPDILEEAKVGLDWMLRCRYKDNKLVTQVQDLRDHEVGWRMPEDDKLQFDRPAFLGIGKNLIGMYAATMAMAYRIWNDRMRYPEFAKRCLDAAKQLYSIRNYVADVDSSGTGSYIDKKYLGKMALGAVELYISTHDDNYLRDAKNYADAAGSDFWWSWGDINSLAHFRLAKYFSKYTEYIEKNLEEFNKNKNGNIFEKGAALSWGTNVTLLGIALQNILYERLSGKTNFDTLATIQRDFILGRNPWGVSFISDVGKNYTQNFHHQVAYLTGKLPGGFAAGPATKNYVDKAKIKFDKTDKYAKFQSKEMYYRDDRQDYITNEPTITGNATAIFVFGNFSNIK